MKKKLLHLVLYLTAVVPVTFLAIFMAGYPATGIAGPSVIQNPAITPVAQVLLPLIRFDPSPTPAVTPTPTPLTNAATLHITPFKAINASTFNANAFVVGNQSVNGAQLLEMRIDLSTAIFPDMVFDPFGTAGDTVAKDLTIDVKEGMSLSGHSYEQPRDGGFDVLVLRFNGFDPGDRFEFSVDVDPTSIQGSGAPGPGESGSVGGLELVGAMVTATFDTGEVLVNQVWRMADRGPQGPNHSGAVAVLRAGLPPRPQIQITGITPPAVAGNANQTVRVGGPPGQPVTVLVVEGGLFTQGLPNGGHDIEPFEANNALVAREYDGVVGPSGSVDIPLMLSRTVPEGGLNHISAAFDNYYGVKGLVAPALVLELP